MSANHDHENPEPVVDPASTSWHLDRHIPLALLIAILMQAFTSVWWAANQDARLAAVERALITSQTDHEAIIRIDARVANISDRLERMDP